MDGVDIERREKKGARVFIGRGRDRAEERLHKRGTQRHWGAQFESVDDVEISAFQRPSGIGVQLVMVLLLRED